MLETSECSCLLVIEFRVAILPLTHGMVNVCIGYYRYNERHFGPSTSVHRVIEKFVTLM